MAAGRSVEVSTSDRHQQYGVKIPVEDRYDDSYYNVIFDNSVAMSLKNFMSKFEKEDSFKSRIRARAILPP